MNRFLALLVLSLLCSPSFSQIKTAEELLAAMHKKHQGTTCRTLTFSQLTYRPNDSLNRRMVWYEAIEYPDKLRIDFNSVSKGNAALFCNDSTFQFRNGIRQIAHADKNDLLLILGGMYFRSLDDVIKRLAELGYDFSRFSETTWYTHPVYVLGALKGDTTSNQIWVDKKELRVLRMLSRLSAKEELDIHVEGGIPACGGFLETKFSFFLNGKLDQREEYTDIHTNIPLDPAIFNPARFGTVHWKKPK
jgi:hypothetical protein